ncbi:hypothetical protein DEU42_101190 [Flavobacterium sp. AG291]|nr:hypothetical protein DEU42_101190 [Flavobacterium sp. AG291]
MVINLTVTRLTQIVLFNIFPIFSLPKPKKWNLINRSFMNMPEKE